MNRVERPAGVTLIAILNIVTAIIFALAVSPWDPLADQALLARVASITTFNQTLIVSSWLAVAAVLHFLAGIGLFLMKPWAWRLTILLTGVGLAVYLAFDLLVHPVSIRLALYAAIAFYLNTRNVRDAFLRRRGTDEVPR
jgi:hypothetical protein